MLIAQLTDAGVEKLVNEDSLLSVAWAFPCSTGVERFELLIVADGMGGAVAGDTASQETISKIVEQLGHSLTNAYREPRAQPEGCDLAYALQGAIEYANSWVYRIAERNPSFKGMGAALVAVLIHGPEALIAHVGDCRCYRLRGRTLTQLTKDHSLVQLMVDRGQITPQEAFRHENDYVMLQAIGTEATVYPEIHTYRLQVGDILILASDGAVSDVPVADLLRVVGVLPASPTEADLRALAQGLVGTALDPDIGMTLDNVSVLVARAEALDSCVEPHALATLPYGTHLAADPAALATDDPTYGYGYTTLGFRLDGAAGPSWDLDAIPEAPASA